MGEKTVAELVEQTQQALGVAEGLANTLADRLRCEDRVTSADERVARMAGLRAKRIADELRMIDTEEPGRG